MGITYEVWAVHPDSVSRKQKMVANYSQSQWQFAMKRAARLEDDGFEDVDIVSVQEYDNSEEERTCSHSKSL